MQGLTQRNGLSTFEPEPCARCIHSNPLVGCTSPGRQVNFPAARLLFFSVYKHLHRNLPRISIGPRVSWTMVSCLVLGMPVTSERPSIGSPTVGCMASVETREPSGCAWAYRVLSAVLRNRGKLRQTDEFRPCIYCGVAISISGHLNRPPRILCQSFLSFNQKPKVQRSQPKQSNGNENWNSFSIDHPSLVVSLFFCGDPQKAGGSFNRIGVLFGKIDGPGSSLNHQVNQDAPSIFQPNRPKGATNPISLRDDCNHSFQPSFFSKTGPFSINHPLLVVSHFLGDPQKPADPSNA